MDDLTRNMASTSYKFRIYPTAEQRRQLAIDFGCARWAWNKGLDYCSRAYTDEQASVTPIDFSREVTFLKTLEPYCWLKDANSTVIIQKLRDLDAALKNFFEKRAHYPKFKKKLHQQSARYQIDQRQVHRLYDPGNFLRLPKLGPLKIKWSRVPAGIPKMATITIDSLGHYYVSFMTEQTIEPLPKLNNSVGIDRGIKDVMVSSEGNKTGAPKFIRQYERKLNIAQRVLSRRTKGSHRWQQARHRVAKIQAKIAACRLDFTHKATTKLVGDYQVVALEDLNVKGMMKNHRLAKSIGDSCLHEVKRQIEYKANWYGREVAFCNRWAPTSKTCSHCGAVQDKMPLHVREWTCSVCDTAHDRDINAAINVLTFATAGRSESYARGGVQPPEGEVTKTPRQRTPTKREFAELAS